MTFWILLAVKCPLENGSKPYGHATAVPPALGLNFSLSSGCNSLLTLAKIPFFGLFFFSVDVEVCFLMTFFSLNARINPFDFSRSFSVVCRTKIGWRKFEKTDFELILLFRFRYLLWFARENDDHYHLYFSQVLRLLQAEVNYFNLSQKWFHLI